MRWLVLASMLVAAPAAAQIGGFQGSRLGSGGPWLSTAGGTLSGGLTLSAGHLTLGLNQQLILDDDNDSYPMCTADDTCALYSGGNSRLSWSNSGIGLTSNVTASVVALLFESATYVRLPRQVSTSAPAAPTTCNATNAGALVYVDDTNDGAAAQECRCWGTTDDGAGNVTYDWVRSTDFTTACGFF